MLQQTANLPTTRTRGWLLVAAIALVGVLPYRVTAADTDHSPASATATQQDLPPVPPTPPAPPAPPLSALPAVPPVPAPPPPPATPQDISGLHVHHSSISIHSNASEGFALFDGDTAIVNGSDADLAAAKRLQRNGKAMLWFRRGDQAWLIDDPAYLKRARAAWAPLEALARQQGELGGKQGALGGKQGALGAQQGVLGARQGQLAGQRAMLAGQRATLAAQASQRDDAADDKNRQTALDTREQALDRQQDALSKQQTDLGRQQAELGKQQAALGEQQEALGQRQEQASDAANRQIRKLLDEAIAKGVAKPAKRG